MPGSRPASRRILKGIVRFHCTNKLIAFQAFRQLSLKDQLHELKSSFPDILTKKRISLFLETTGIQLQTIANMPHPVADDDLHELRKRLKDILYNYTYIKKVAADLLPAIALAGDETLKQLAGALGMILDIASGIQLLSAFTAFRADNEREKQLLTAIGRKWTKEKEALKKELYPRLTILIPEAGPGHLFEKTNILH